MKEQELKRNLLAERNEVRVPKRAIYRAIDAGMQQADGKKYRRINLRQTVVILGIAALALVGTGVSGIADGLFSQWDRIPAVSRIYDGLTVRPEANQRAEAFDMKSGIGYWAEGERSPEATVAAGDIFVKPGIYDVTLVKGVVGEPMISGVLLPGETYRSYWFEEGNFAEAHGKDVEFRFTPAGFTPLEKQGDQYELENVFGEFEVGTMVEAGIYRVTVAGASTFDKGWSVSVTTENRLPNGDGFGTGGDFSKDEFGERIIELKKGSMLKISRVYWPDESDENGVDEYKGTPPQVKLTLAKITEEAAGYTSSLDE